MKRMIALALALCLCAGLCLPALAAAPSMEDTLADVTALVKETLQVDDDYTDFYGDYYEDLVQQWSLNWSDEDRSLSVTCDGDGKILDVYAYTYSDDNDRFYGFDPAFPPVTAEDARAQAEDWLSRLMGEGETARIDRVSSTLGEDGDYRYYGTILLNGLESPITFSIRMDKNGLRNYSRSDGYGTYVGEIPAPNSDVVEKDASDALFEAVEMELYYVLREDGEARLEYVPVGAETVVDALTGEAVDMDALYAGFQERGGVAYGLETADAEAPAAAAGANRAALSEMELASIANYGDVMTQEELDAILRAVGELGLNDTFTIQRCSYSMDSETGEVTASLRYTAPMTEDALYGFSAAEYDEYASWGDELTIYKYISMDAKTGRLLSLSTSYPLWERQEPGEMNPQALARMAETFLSRYAVELYPQTALCTLSGYETGDCYTYARVENGYFYPENYLYVALNSATGTVDEYYFNWDEDVTFASAEGIVTQEAAETAYAEALDVTLGYVAWPEEIRRDDPELLRYMEWGYTWVESLRLAWYYGGTDSISAVDALTGEAIVNTHGEDGAYTYTDLNGLTTRKTETEAIEALGQAGIGFAGGVFERDKELTQREALWLLLQAAGYDPADWEDETIRSEAVYQGFITEAEWAPEETVTRMDWLKMLLGASRYGYAAELSGVWSIQYEDVANADRGYGALAQALGLAGGSELRPDDPCTRGEAAYMLYMFMKPVTE